MLHPPPPVPTTVMRAGCRKRQNSSDRKLLHQPYDFDYRQPSPARVCCTAIVFLSRMATNSTLGTRHGEARTSEPADAGDISHSIAFRGCWDATFRCQIGPVSLFK